VIRTDILLADELFVDDGEPELVEFRTDPVEVVVLLADSVNVDVSLTGHYEKVTRTPRRSGRGGYQLTEEPIIDQSH